MAAASAASAVRAARAPAGAIAPQLASTYVIDVSGQSPAQRARTLAGLRLDPAVEYAEEDRQARAFFLPNDPRYSEMYGLTKIRAATAWDTARGVGTVVAVVDGGLDFAHPDIDGNFWVNTGEIAGNGIDDDGNGRIDDRRGWDFVAGDNDPRDESGHGTHVAGTVAAEGNNAVGVIGVAWQTKLMALRGLDADGNGLASDLAAAIVYATDEGADIINASWGGDGTAQVLVDAVDHAIASGVVFVAAAGNAERDVSGIFPANHPRAIVVSATDAADVKASFSNFGAGLDLAAPGVEILSLESGTAGYVLQDGTSMSAPHVSGAAALVLGRRPAFTIEQVRQALRFSAVDLGAAGFDPLYGHGRLNAAAAVALDQVLEAKIVRPTSTSDLVGPVAVTGFAQGTGFARWVLEYAAGESPTSWTSIRQSTTPANGGTLATFDPGALPEGRHTLRLRAIDTAGRTFQDRVVFQLRYVSIDSPAAQALPESDVVWKPGAPLSVVGRAAGPGFVRYRIEWAPGRQATSGWSTLGVSLSGGGTAPAVDATLGTWTPPATLSGFHTLRLVVDAAAGSTIRTTSVYLERDLLAAGWPVVFRDFVRYEESPIPVRQGDGSLRLVSCGYGSCALYAADGSGRTIQLGDMSHASPAVGELDPSPGEEVLVVEGPIARIYSADLTPLRTIDPPGDVYVSESRPLLADIDGDGALEILVLADASDGSPRTLHVYRANGQPVGGQFPRAIDPRAFEPAMLAVDLDGDRRKEIVVIEEGADFAQYRLLAFRSDGSVYPAWNTSYVTAAPQARLAAADLDRDGKPEVLVQEQERLRVLDHTGYVRPGWPVPLSRDFDYASPAIGDLDLDGRDDIVVSTQEGVTVFRPDGSTALSFSLSTVHRRVGRPVLGDVDGDGFPDILVGYSVPGSQSNPDFAYETQRLRATSRTGVTIKDWPLGGSGMSSGFAGIPLLTDLDQDGRVDIAVRQDSNVGAVVRVLTTGGAFDPARMPWPFVYRDPQLSRVALQTAGSALSAVADAYVRDGAAAATNFGTATSLQIKNGAAGNVRWTYVRFPLAGLNRGVASARLRLHGSRTAATTATLSAYGVASTSWGETTLTWNNKPALGARQGERVIVTPGARYYEWDVSAFVKAQQAAGATAVSLAITMDQSTPESPDSFASREAAANRPELMVTLVPPPPPVTVAAGADAHVRDGTSAAANFGSATTLEVKGASTAGGTRVAYLRFSLASVPTGVGSARLRLYGSRPVASTSTDAVFAVASNSWGETTLTWNNRPALGAKQGASVTITRTARYYEWDVTAFVQAQKAAGATAVSLAVKMDQAVTDGPDVFNSRQATANRPELVVVGN